MIDQESKDILLFVAGLVGCFVVCWIVSLLMGMTGFGKILEKFAGPAVGAGAIALAHESDSPGLLYGTIVGWVLYIFSFFVVAFS